MSCQVAPTSPTSFPDSLFEDEWRSASGGELDAIAGFNGNFQKDGDCAGGIDPQLLSNPSSPASGSNFDGDNGFDSHQHNFNPYPDVSQMTTGPYFHSIEHDSATGNDHTGTLNFNRHMQPPQDQHANHRRSFSEPPGHIPHHPPNFLSSQYTRPKSPQSQTHLQSGSPPAMVLHRSGHFLGTPKMQNQQQPQLQRLKSVPKGGHRQKPYPTKQDRYQLRRTQTQPGRAVAPTSAPMPQHLAAPPVDGRYFASRVCTPIPEHTQGPSVSPQPLQSKSAVAIPVGLEELRGLIEEAVKKAVLESRRVDEERAIKAGDVDDPINGEKVGV